MMFLDEQGNRWYKGNLHTHTTRSDGQRSPEEAIGIYRAAGYDFLALTDHWTFGEPRAEEDFLLLSGCEYDVGQNVRDGIYHIVGIGMETDPKLERGQAVTAQSLIDSIHAADGLAILAHPAWSLNRAGEVARLTGLDGCEIFNSTSDLPWNCRPYSGAFLDELATWGQYPPCMAADDAHGYTGDQTRSWLMVRADELSRDAILAAIRRGDFYATQGPRFSVEQTEGRLIVRSTPVQSIVFFTDSVWVPDRATCGDGVCEAVYELKSYERFVRIELTDAEGRSAWSSFFVSD